MQASEHTLVYFPHRGRGDVCELLCHLGSIPLDCKRVDFPNFLKLKEKEVLPYNQLPVLYVESTKRVVAQTGAIVRYIAKCAKLYPEEDIDAAVAESVLERINDLNTISWYLCKTDEDRGNFLKDLASKKLPSFFRDIERLIDANRANSDWIVSESASFADLALFSTLHELHAMGLDIEVIMPKTVARHYKATGSIPKVKDFATNQWKSLRYPASL